MPVEENPFDDARLSEIRASQEDPIVQYYIVRKDIGMSVGKACAQVAHAAQMFMIKYFAIKGTDETDSRYMKKLIEDTSKWMDGSFRKVVLGGNAKDFEKIKYDVHVFVVRDAGLTEIELGTETVLVTWPQLRSACPKILKRLQVLKVLEVL